MPDTFDYPVEWAPGIEETLQFRTNIIQSESGYETRRALRKTPRQSLRFNVLLQKEDYGRFSLEMSQKAAREFTINHIRKESVQSSSFVGFFRVDLFTQVSVDRNLNLGVSNIGYIQDDGITTPNGTLDIEVPGYSGFFRVNVIRRLPPGNTRRLNLFTDDNRAFPTDTRLRAMMNVYQIISSEPKLTGHIEPVVVNSLTDTTAVVPIQFNANPTGGHLDNNEMLTFYDEFEGRPVFDLPHNWTTPSSTALLETISELNFVNNRFQESMYDFTTRSQQHSLLIDTEEKYQKLLQIFLDSKGRQKPFWFVSPLTELMPKSNVSPTNTLTLPGSTWHTYYLTDDRYEYFRLYRKSKQALDDEWVTCKIIHARLDANGDSVLEVVVLDSANHIVIDSAYGTDYGENWGGSAHLFTRGYDADQLYARWMLLSRFDSDTMTFRWISKTVCLVNIAVRQLHLAGI